jgi:hypothetical protein
MTEEQKKFLKEIGDINDGISIYSRKKLRETFPELFEQPKERYHIDVRIECDKTDSIKDLKFETVKLMLTTTAGCIYHGRNATITEIPFSETLANNQLMSLNSANAKLHQINKDLEAENEKLKEALNKIKFIYSNYQN